MNLMTIPYRTSHIMMKGVLNVLKLPIPPSLVGPGMVKRFPEIISLCDVHKALVITDKPLMEMGLLDGFLAVSYTHLRRRRRQRLSSPLPGLWYRRQ